MFDDNINQNQDFLVSSNNYRYSRVIDKEYSKNYISPQNLLDESNRNNIHINEEIKRIP